jgi:hypothetical protein
MRRDRDVPRSSKEGKDVRVEPDSSLNLPSSNLSLEPPLRLEFFRVWPENLLAFVDCGNGDEDDLRARSMLRGGGREREDAESYLSFLDLDGGDSS